MAITYSDALKWANSMNFGSNSQIIEIILPISALDSLYFQPSLDGIGAAFSGLIEFLNSIVESIK